MRKHIVMLLLLALAGALLLFSGSVPTVLTGISPSQQINPSATDDPEIPLPRARERVTLKPFGIRVSPADSPVAPERFTGYHTGSDFEVLPGEDETKLQVRALCFGPVVDARRISGYGGVAIQRCTVLARPITILYGHLSPSSLPDVGTDIPIGGMVGLLGRGYSADTDGERPHLHLSVIDGARTDVRGYVSDPAQLEGWLDPMPFVP